MKTIRMLIYSLDAILQLQNLIMPRAQVYVTTPISKYIGHYYKCDVQYKYKYII